MALKVSFYKILELLHTINASLAIRRCTSILQDQHQPDQMFHLTALPPNLCPESVPHHLLDLTCHCAIIWDCFHGSCNLSVHTCRSGMGQIDSWDMYQHHHELVRQCWLLDSYGCHHPVVADAHHTLSATPDKSESRLNAHLWSRSVVSLPFRIPFYILDS
jgi:hypothetical protein